MRTKPVLTESDTLKIITAAKEEAVKNNWKVSIAIVDDGGHLLRFERLDGASVPSSLIAIGKAKTAALSKLSTKLLEDGVKERPALLAFPDRIAVQGGLPLMYEGECVGAVGVSGVKSAEDEQVADAGVKVL